MPLLTAHCRRGRGTCSLTRDPLGLKAAAHTRVPTSRPGGGLEGEPGGLQHMGLVGVPRPLFLPRPLALPRCHHVLDARDFGFPGPGFLFLQVLSPPETRFS